MITRWHTNPLFREFNSIAHELNRYNREFSRAATVNRHSGIGFEWAREGDNLTISAELPGYTSDDINIALESGNRLTVSGTRNSEPHDEGARYLRRERRINSFERSIKLPFGIDAEGVKADYSDGILTIELPRAEADKPRQIAVNAA